MITKKRINRKLKQALPLFISFSIVLFILLIAIRIFELTFITIYFKFPPRSWEHEIRGFLYDMLFGLKMCSWMVIPFFLLFQFNRIVSYIYFWFFSAIIIIGSVVLLFYFGSAKVPLGADLFGYSVEEISSTVGASGGFNIASIIALSVTVILMVILFWKVRFYHIHRLVQTFIVFGLFPVLFINIYGTVNPAKYKNEFNAFLVSNKAGFFIKSNIDHFFPDDDTYVTAQTNSDTSSTAKNNVASSLQVSAIIDSRYPLMHRDTTSNLLGRYFNIGSTLPNFVFIITESLGRAYSGNGAYLGSFTPYLDQLATKGLYWSNMLSTSGRTFSVMPSIFASLPFGEHGFCEMGDKMPYQQSLISILMSNGYQSSFYYGGHSEFDNMSVFMKKQGVSRIVDEKNFEIKYKRIPGKQNGFSWGYGDKETFSKYLSDIKQLPSTPRIDIILTLSMHDPFLLDSSRVYDKKFSDRLLKLELGDDTKNYDKQYKAQLETVLYFDDALKRLISEYSKRPDFQNTIFIITGDHRMPEIPISTQIDRFHVPLVIWSPMLKNPSVFSSISTHFDITPSILAFLSDKYKIKLPSVVSWLGTGLDFEPNFRNTHSYALMRNKTELMDYLDGMYFLSGTTLYQLSPNLDIQPVDDEQHSGRMRDKFNSFMKMNTKVCLENKILPDTVKVR